MAIVVLLVAKKKRGKCLWNDSVAGNERATFGLPNFGDWASRRDLPTRDITKI